MYNKSNLEVSLNSRRAGGSTELVEEHDWDDCFDYNCIKDDKLRPYVKINLNSGGKRCFYNNTNEYKDISVPFNDLLNYSSLPDENTSSCANDLDTRYTTKLSRYIIIEHDTSASITLIGIFIHKNDQSNSTIDGIVYCNSAAGNSHPQSILNTVGNTFTTTQMPMVKRFIIDLGSPQDVHYIDIMYNSGSFNTINGATVFLFNQIVDYNNAIDGRNLDQYSFDFFETVDSSKSIDSNTSRIYTQNLTNVDSIIDRSRAINETIDYNNIADFNSSVGNYRFDQNLYNNYNYSIETNTDSRCFKVRNDSVPTLMLHNSVANCMTQLDTNCVNTNPNNFLFDSDDITVDTIDKYFLSCNKDFDTRLRKPICRYIRIQSNDTVNTSGGGPVISESNLQLIKFELIGIDNNRININNIVVHKPISDTSLYDEFLNSVYTVLPTDPVDTTAQSDNPKLVRTIEQGENAYIQFDLMADITIKEIKIQIPINTSCELVLINTNGDIVYENIIDG